MRCSELGKGQKILGRIRQIFSIQLKPTRDFILNKWKKYPGLYLYYSPDVNFGVLYKNKMLSN